MGMNPRTFDRWVAALESGKYEKGKFRLKSTTASRYCCLGVLERVCGVSDDSESIFDRAYVKLDEDDDPLPHRGLSTRTQKVLSNINDSRDSFEPIVAYLKRNRSRLIAK